VSFDPGAMMKTLGETRQALIAAPDLSAALAGATAALRQTVPASDTAMVLRDGASAALSLVTHDAIRPLDGDELPEFRITIEQREARAVPATWPGAPTDAICWILPLVRGDVLEGAVGIAFAEPIASTSPEHRMVALWADVVASEIACRRRLAIEHEHASLVENTPQLIYRLDPDGVVTFANRATLAVLDKTLDDVRGAPFADIFPSELSTAALAALRTSDDDAVTLESRQPSGDDAALVTTHRVHALRDGAGALIGFLGFALDVSRERQARRLHEDLVEALGDFVFMADATGQLLAANRKARDVLGWSAADIATMTIWDLHPPEEAAKVEQERWRILETGASTFEIGLRMKSSGRTIPTRARVTYSPESGTLQGVFRDVREERLVQDRLVQVERLRALGEMASGVAHTFNNLLAVIGTTVQVARRLVDDPRVRHELDTIQQAVYDGGASVRRIQDFTRKRPHELHIDLALGDLLTEVAQISRHRARELGATGITVKVEIDDPPAVHGSRSELKDVFLNLTFNAIDAIGSTGQITVRAYRLDDRTAIEVTDTGRGMTEEIRNRVFTPFFSTKGERGSGLGLAIALNVVSQHGGAMSIESEPDHGTTVQVLLPPAASTDRSTAKPARVLLAESEPLLRAQLERAITGAGHLVTTAGSRQETIDRLQAAAYDCVFADLAALAPDALEVAARAKARGARVVLLAGWGDEVSSDAVREHRVDAVLRKPFPAEAVLNLID